MDVNDLRLIYIYEAEIGTDHHLVLMTLKVKRRMHTKKSEKRGQNG